MVGRAVTAESRCLLRVLGLGSLWGGGMAVPLGPCSGLGRALFEAVVHPCGHSALLSCVGRWVDRLPQSWVRPLPPGVRLLLYVLSLITRCVELRFRAAPPPGSEPWLDVALPMDAGIGAARRVFQRVGGRSHVHTLSGGAGCRGEQGLCWEVSFGQDLKESMFAGRRASGLRAS